MTKKDYEVIAIAMRRSRPPKEDFTMANEVAWAQWLQCRHQLICTLTMENRLFNERIFMQATEL